MDEEYEREHSKSHKSRDSKMKEKQTLEKLQKSYEKGSKPKKDEDAKLGLSITDIIRTPNSFRSKENVRNENDAEDISVVSFEENMDGNDDFDEDEDEDEDFEDEEDDDEFDHEYRTRNPNE